MRFVEGKIKTTPKQFQRTRTPYTYKAPDQWHGKWYYSQVEGRTLFMAMRQAIRSPCPRHMVHHICALWEVQSMDVFITDKGYAKRAALILGKAQGFDVEETFIWATGLRFKFNDER